MVPYMQFVSFSIPMSKATKLTPTSCDTNASIEVVDNSPYQSLAVQRSVQCGPATEHGNADNEEDVQEVHMSPPVAPCHGLSEGWLAKSDGQERAGLYQLRDMRPVRPILRILRG
jgi:hypothetical protein